MRSVKSWLSRKCSSLVMVGAFPPPVHGMAAVNKAVCDALLKRGAEPWVINLASEGLNRSLFERIRRAFRIFGGLVKLVIATGLSGKPLYMSVSGGFGQAYEVLFCLFARIKKMRLFLHHHSFAYIDKPTGLTWLLAKSAGLSAIHVGLSDDMTTKLKNVYSIRNVVPISNAAFLPRKARCSRREGLRTIGFLGNICEEKGVYDFLGVCAAAQQQGIDLRGVLAGPFQDAHTETKVRTSMEGISNVHYVGPRYGEDKDRFFDGIDVLMFPTRYVNEAEPVTIHEALRSGLPVIAFGRGAIPETIDDECGMVISPQEVFIPKALERIKLWQADSVKFRAASQAATDRFERFRTENQERLDDLLTELGGRGELGDGMNRRRNGALR